VQQKKGGAKHGKHRKSWVKLLDNKTNHRIRTWVDQSRAKRLWHNA